MARMSHRRVVLLRSSVAVALLLVLLVAAAADGGIAGQLVVRAANGQLVDAGGTPIRLLGVNRSGAEYACVGGWGFFDGPTDPHSVAAMKAWGINAVRLPLNEDCWLGINGVSPKYSGTAYRNAVASYVRLLHSAGIFVVLDLHWSAPGTKEATGQEEMADLDHSPAFWSSVAHTFRHDHAVVFDLFNEPHGIDWPCWRDGCWISEGWQTAGMQTLVDAVRRTGARQPIVATGIDWGTNLKLWLRYRPRDPAGQLIAGFHAFNFAHCTTVRCWNGTIAPVARRFPVIATELGENDCATTFSNRYMDWADQHGVSYLAWTWNPTGCRAPALIQSWSGAATPFGAAIRRHLLRLQQVSRKEATP
jgi:endoglucanase